MIEVDIGNMNKQELLEYMNNPKPISGVNIMGCSESWYDPYYAIYQTFTSDEVSAMSEREVTNLLKLAQNISEGLY